MAFTIQIGVVETARRPFRETKRTVIVERRFAVPPEGVDVLLGKTTVMVELQSEAWP